MSRLNDSFNWCPFLSEFSKLTIFTNPVIKRLCWLIESEKILDREKFDSCLPNKEEIKPELYGQILAVN